MKRGKQHPTGQPNGIYSTMAYCSADTGVPKSVLRLAKTKGAPGFIGYRIDWNQLKPWLDLHGKELEEEATDNLQAWKTRKTKADALMAEIQLDELKEKYLIKEEVMAQVKAVALAQKNILKSKLCNELPPRLLGMNVTDISIEMDKVLKEVCLLMENLTL